MPRNATIADLVVEANDTGKEAIFLGTDGTTSYEFTPAGIAQYMSDEGLTGGGSEGEPVADLGPGDVEVVGDATAASTDTSAASLTSVNASFATLNGDLSALTQKVNELLTSLRDAGIIGE
jgi:hypothetical protein